MTVPVLKVPTSKVHARRHGTTARHAPPLRGLLPLAIAIAVWQIFGDPKSPYFPPPGAWIDALGELWASGRLQPAILTTLLTFLAALILASLIGAALGIALGRSALTDRLLGPAFEFARTMPAGAIVPVAVLVIGYTQSMTLAVVVFASLWPVLLSTRAGAKQIGVERLEAAQVMLLSRGDTFRKIVLPSLTSSILLGIQIAAPLALIITLVVEVITQVSGLGREIGLAQSNFRSAAVYGLVAVTGVIGLLVNLGVGQLARLTRRFEI